MKIPVLGPEEWKPIPGYSGYEVSNYGNFRTYHSANGRGTLRIEPRELKPRSISGKPYLRVRLTRFGRQKHDRKAHVLILETFVGPCPNGYESRHLDGNHKNNRLDNLLWGTAQENADDRQIHGTQICGEQIANSVLTENQIQEIKQAIPNWERGFTSIFSKKFGVSRSTINAVRDGITWRHV